MSGLPGIWQKEVEMVGTRFLITNRFRLASVLVYQKMQTISEGYRFDVSTDDRGIVIAINTKEESMLLKMREVFQRLELPIISETEVQFSGFSD